ncbi:hypothetical protein [Scandinavium goeteborgense]|uniref:hypothetical protein n=1 Tax=Scandinavium goeteborgense TaxID=1851514 RepID=UPI001FEA5D9D|nr:hypothetical protein [Scandinavium goeteborgense]
MRCERWQEWETKFLQEVGGSMPIHLIAEKLERSNGSIYSKAAAIGVDLIDLRRGRPWTKAEEFMFGHFSCEEIAEATRRTIASVRCKRHKLEKENGGSLIPAWTRDELELLWRHNNARVAELTGRSIEEVGDRRLQANIERKGWDMKDPEQEVA